MKLLNLIAEHFIREAKKEFDHLSDTAKETEATLTDNLFKQMMRGTARWQTSLAHGTSLVFVSMPSISKDRMLQGQAR